MKPASSAAALGPGFEALEFDASTRTAADAAAAIGCTVAQIAKSVVFRATRSGRAVVVVASGVNRVNECKVAALVGEPIGRADADFVREKTGFAIGGVPPVAHREPAPTFLDEDLQAYDVHLGGGRGPERRLSIDAGRFATPDGRRVCRRQGLGPAAGPTSIRLKSAAARPRRGRRPVLACRPG
jgi:prolyl-tRNA editing enzyme YbaK/EbsC (Cys-tRNA(Pro) deacylase)